MLLAKKYHFSCKAPFVAITGTNGKTTTTTLTGELLKKTEKKVFVGGNIGVPIISYAADLQKDDVVVAEVSSFQCRQTTTRGTYHQYFSHPFAPLRKILCILFCIRTSYKTRFSY